MAIEFDINGTFTLDETSGLQTGGSGDALEDNNDNDITVAALQAAAPDFYTYLFTAAGLSLLTTDVVGAAESQEDLITVTTDAALNSLGLTQDNGDPFDGTQSSGLTTTSGLPIYLLSTPIDGVANQVVLGVYDDGACNGLPSRSICSPTAHSTRKWTSSCSA